MPTLGLLQAAAQGYFGEKPDLSQDDSPCGCCRAREVRVAERELWDGALPSSTGCCAFLSLA